MSFQAEADGFLFSLPEYEEEAADFVATIGRQFQDAFLRRKRECKLTQQQVAEMLHVNRSFVNRSLSGSSNMTAETMAKLAWALGGRATFSLLLDDDLTRARSNYFVGTTSLSNTITPASDNRVDVYMKPKGASPLQFDSWSGAISYSPATFIEVSRHENS